MAKHTGGASENYNARLQKKIEQKPKIDDVVELEKYQAEYNLPEHAEIVDNLTEEMHELKNEIIQLEKELKEKQNQLYNTEKLRKKVENIHQIFDGTDFQEVNANIENLIQAGVENIKIGKNEYKISIIKKLMNRVIEDFSDKKNLDGIHQGTIPDKIISVALSQMGITREPVSDKSKQGFRECMIQCIKTEAEKISTRVRIIDGEEIRKALAATRKKIQDS
jgi:hypothetical protein